jgi:hypothetical protein
MDWKPSNYIHAFAFCGPSHASLRQRMRIYRLMPLAFLAADLSAQACLSLSPPSISGDQTVILELSLNSPPKARPVAIQWTLSTSSSGVISVAADEGPSLPSGRKAAICVGTAAAYRCIVAGANAEPVRDGLIARITVNLAPGTATPKITLRDSMAVSADGHRIPVTECSPSNRKE